MRLIYKPYIYLIKMMKAKKERTPNYVALTVCVGVVAGLAPIIGQAYLCLLIWIIFRFFKIRFNLIASCALTFISNPFTTPFLFYLFYITGQMLLGENTIPFTNFVSQLNATFKDEYSFQILKETLSNLFHGIAKPMFVGYIPWGIVGGALGYLLGYKVANKLSLRQQRKELARKENTVTLEE